MVVRKTSVLPADRDFVFQKLQQLKTLQYITWLWANAFYAHRQRKWIRMLKQEEA